jgi:hypothetical protein
LVLGALALAGVAAPVCIVVVGVIVLGVIVGMGLELLDKKLGVTEYVKEKGREGESFLKSAWQEHVADPMCRMLYQLEKSIYDLYGVPHF